LETDPEALDLIAANLEAFARATLTPTAWDYVCAVQPAVNKRKAWRLWMERRCCEYAKPGSLIHRWTDDPAKAKTVALEIIRLLLEDRAAEATWPAGFDRVHVVPNFAKLDQVHPGAVCRLSGFGFRYLRMQALAGHPITNGLALVPHDAWRYRLQTYLRPYRPFTEACAHLGLQCVSVMEKFMDYMYDLHLCNLKFGGFGMDDLVVTDINGQPTIAFQPSTCELAQPEMAVGQPILDFRDHWPEWWPEVCQYAYVKNPNHHAKMDTFCTAVVCLMLLAPAATAKALTGGGWWTATRERIRQELLRVSQTELEAGLTKWIAPALRKISRRPVLMDWVDAYPGVKHN